MSNNSGSIDMKHFILDQSWPVLAIAKWIGAFPLDRTLIEDTGKCILHRISFIRFLGSWIACQLVAWSCAVGGGFVYLHQSNATSLREGISAVSRVVAVTPTDSVGLIFTLIAVFLMGVLIAIANWTMAKHLIPNLMLFYAVDGNAIWVSGPLKRELTKKTKKWFYM